MSSETLLSGWITRMQSGFITVLTETDGPVVCHLRGKLKRGRFKGDIIAIGDRVKISLQPNSAGSIESIEPRRSALVRMAPLPHGEYQQILLANPDQVLMVFACAQPEPRLRMLDRFLVICEKQGIPAVIVANKVDLVGLEAAKAIFDVYPTLGYPVIYTSAAENLGTEELRQQLIGKISGLAGPSGVGKSSLLNRIQPDLGLAVRTVSDTTLKGRHTTVVREMFPVVGGGFVADLPGLKSLALWDTEPEELDGYFPELRDLVDQCKYNDCTHRVEPGCAVREAVNNGQVSKARYDSYIRMRFGDEE
jgi:ribosome biogenesis GTPase